MDMHDILLAPVQGLVYETVNKTFLIHDHCHNNKSFLFTMSYKICDKLLPSIAIAIYVPSIKYQRNQSTDSFRSRISTIRHTYKFESHLLFIKYTSLNVINF